MKYSLNGELSTITSISAAYIWTGLIGHVKNRHPVMNTIYLGLKQRNLPPTAEELSLATGEKKVNSSEMRQYLEKMTQGPQPLMAAFAKQAELATVRSFMSLFACSVYSCLGAMGPEKI